MLKFISSFFKHMNKLLSNMLIIRGKIIKIIFSDNISNSVQCNKYCINLLNMQIKCKLRNINIRFKTTCNQTSNTFPRR